MAAGKCEEIEEIEALLYEYPNLVSEVNLRLLDHQEEQPISAVDYEKPNTSPTNKFFSFVEFWAGKLGDLDSELDKKLKKKRAIELSLECLGEREFEIVSLYYWKRLRRIDCAERLDVSPATIDRYKDIALNRLKRIGLMRTKCIRKIS